MQDTGDGSTFLNGQVRPLCRRQESQPSEAWGSSGEMKGLLRTQGIINAQKGQNGWGRQQ